MASNTTIRRDRAPRVLAPVLAVNDRLRTSARLAVLVAVLLLPCAVATWAYAGAIGGQVDFAAKERLGVEVLRPALRALTGAVAGDTADLTELDAAVKAHPQLDLGEAMDAVRQAAGGGRVAVAQALVGLVTQIGNDSNLILDPDLDSFYLMDAQVVQLPKALLAAAQAAAPRAAAGSEALVAEQAVHAGELSGAAGALGSDIATAVQNTKAAGLAGRLAAVGPVQDAVKALAATLTASLERTGLADPKAAATAAATAADPLGTELDSLLATRIGGLAGKRTMTLVVTFAGLCVAVWFAAAVWWRNRNEVGLTVTGVTALASGDLSERPLPGGRDELGDIGRALEQARRTLADQDAELRAAQHAREEQMRTSFTQQRRAERQARERAQTVVDENAGAVLAELDDVMAQVEAVRAAARTIEDRVAAADAATRSVVEHAHGTDEVVSVLDDSLRRVADTASLIAGVADQTKLLALNATIEAARAGEAGRGFSVVAGEVKELAASTATSTEQIASTVSSLKQDAGAMAETITRMAAGIDSVDEANAVLRQVATDQYALVERLERAARQAMERMRGMAELTEQLERRHHERTATAGPARLRAGDQSYEAKLLDLSTGGACAVVADPVPLRVGADVEAVLDLAGTPLTLPARVVYREEDGAAQRLGLSFLSPDPHAVGLIQAYVRRLSAEDPA
jgi:methyl-accepting chemotaxis protein